jgi:5-methyltetrahydropteroyltriglutamate--homocysteine methyltransferase
MTKNELVSWTKVGKQRSFLVCKGALSRTRRQRAGGAARGRRGTGGRGAAGPSRAGGCAVRAGTGRHRHGQLAAPALAGRGHACACAGPAGRQGLPGDRRRRGAPDRQCAQQRAGATVYTDGEQRRDSYASFVATRLDNCQLVPLIDLLPLVEDPAAFEAELRALDVPAGEVRHPGVFGRIRRSRPIAVHEFDFLRTLTPAPIKVACRAPTC